MSLKKIGSRDSTSDSTAFELSPISGADSKILGDSHVPWAKNTTYFLELLPGRYRIDRTEASKIEIFSKKPWEQVSTHNASIFYLETHSSGGAVYLDGDGTVFITRLA